MFIETRIKRLGDLARQRPMFAEMFDYYARLYKFFGREREAFLSVSPDRQNEDLRRREGFPLLRGELLQVDGRRAGEFLRGMVAILERHGKEGAEDLAALRAALEREEIDIPRLARASVDRDRRPVAQCAENLNLQPALLEYVLGLMLGYGLQRCREEGLSAKTDGWDHGHCPLCGGLPVMGELVDEEGKKRLQCGLCATSWEFSRLKCSHCGNDGHDSLEYFTANGEPGYRVDICRRCSCYLKIVDSRGAGRGLPLDIEDIATLHLDMLARKEGFTQGKKKPLAV